MRISFFPLLMFFLEPVCGFADARLIAMSALEQGYNRQTTENQSLPIVANLAKGTRICAIGAQAPLKTIAVEYLDFLNAASESKTELTFVDSFEDCPMDSRRFLSFLPRDFMLSFQKLIDGIEASFNVVITGPGDIFLWEKGYGNRAIFAIDDKGSLYAVGFVRTDVSPSVQKALTIRGLFQLTLTGQSVEWAGDLFSINQKSASTPSENDTLLPSGSTSNFFGDYNRYNSMGLCWADAMMTVFISRHLGDDNSPMLALDLLNSKFLELFDEFYSENLIDKFPELFDSRCSTPPKVIIE